MKRPHVRFPRSLRMHAAACGLVPAHRETFASRLRQLGGEEGGSLVEMALASAGVLAMLFGIFELSMALYSYHFVSEAAREASRFAMVRGSQCAANFTASYCSPTDAQTTGADGGDISNYVNSLGYPFANKLTTSTTWLSSGQDAKGNEIWTSCGTASSCKTPGNQVQVTVSYPFPLNVPFLRTYTINLASKSSVVISQ